MKFYFEIFDNEIKIAFQKESLTKAFKGLIYGLLIPLFSVLWIYGMIDKSFDIPSKVLLTCLLILPFLLNKVIKFIYEKYVLPDDEKFIQSLEEILHVKIEKQSAQQRQAKMKNTNLNNDINALWENFLQVRATYPYARIEHIGKSIIQSPSYYTNKGLKFKVEFEKPLQELDIQRLNALGYWINQSLILRLYALLEYYGIISETIKINKDLDGHEELDILRRLRKYFAHTGKYNLEDKEQFILFNRIVKHFNLHVYDQDSFPIPIDSVLEVIFIKVKKYIEQV